MITKLSINLGLKIKVHIRCHVQLNSSVYPFLNHMQIGGQYFKNKSSKTHFIKNDYKKIPLKLFQLDGVWFKGDSLFELHLNLDFEDNG